MAKDNCFYQIFPGLSQLKDLVPSQDQGGDSGRVNCGPCWPVNRGVAWRGMKGGLGTRALPAPSLLWELEGWAAQPVAMRRSRGDTWSRACQWHGKEDRSVKKTQQIPGNWTNTCLSSGQNLESQTPDTATVQFPDWFCFLALSPGTLDRLSSSTATPECIQVVAIQLIPQGWRKRTKKKSFYSVLSRFKLLLTAKLGTTGCSRMFGFILALWSFNDA